jgi:hypothetical protein
MRALLRFRVPSPNQENGFVGRAVRFVADPARNSFTGSRVPLRGFLSARPWARRFKPAQALRRALSPVRQFFGEMRAQRTRGPPGRLGLQSANAGNDCGTPPSATRSCMSSLKVALSLWTLSRAARPGHLVDRTALKNLEGQMASAEGKLNCG